MESYVLLSLLLLETFKNISAASSVLVYKFNAGLSWKSEVKGYWQLLILFIFYFKLNDICRTILDII